MEMSANAGPRTRRARDVCARRTKAKCELCWRELGRLRSMAGRRACEARAALGIERDDARIDATDRRRQEGAVRRYGNSDMARVAVHWKGPVPVTIYEADREQRHLRPRPEMQAELLRARSRYGVSSTEERMLIAVVRRSEPDVRRRGPCACASKGFWAIHRAFLKRRRYNAPIKGESKR